MGTFAHVDRGTAGTAEKHEFSAPRYVSIVLVLRVIHIQRSGDSRPDNPRYDIIDAGPHGDEADLADVAHSITRQDLGEWLTRAGVSFTSVGRILEELVEKGSAQVQAPPRIGPRIVRAWFDTVLNPLIQSVELELGLLEGETGPFRSERERLNLSSQ